MRPTIEIHPSSPTSRSFGSGVFSRRVNCLLAAASLIAITFTTGCGSPQARRGSMSHAAMGAESQAYVDAVAPILREGDVIRVTVPADQQLNTEQQIRRDGKIALPMMGEVDAAGLTPVELEAKLTELYSKELVAGDVYVSVASSSFPIFVTGAVVRPGKIETDRPITALEAIMEAGGFELAKANSQAVVVVRHGAEGVKNYTLDLRAALEGRSNDAFYLKPSDIIYVPERFAWF